MVGKRSGKMGKSGRHGTRWKYLTSQGRDFLRWTVHLGRSLPLYSEVLLRNRATSEKASLVALAVAVAAALVNRTLQQTCTYLIDGVTWALVSFIFVGIVGLGMTMLRSFPCPAAVVEFTIDGTIAAVVIQCINRLIH